MSDGISGLWVAVATPLSAGGDVDHDVLARHAHRLLEQGCDGLVLFGTTGEGASFSAAERLAAIEALLGAGVAPAHLGLGAGFPAIGDTVALVRQALGLGLRHMLLLPPYFYRDVTSQGIEDAFARTLDGVGDARLRAMFYHIPQVSGVPVPAMAVSRLRTRYGPLAAGVKDSSGDFAEFLAFRAAAPDVSVVTGSEADIARALAAGGTGTVCGLANLVPALVRAMFTDPAAAAPMAEAVALVGAPFVPTLKAALAALTGEPAWTRVRAPMRSIEDRRGRQIADALRGLQPMRPFRHQSS